MATYPVDEGDVDIRIADELDLADKRERLIPWDVLGKVGQRPAVER